ncbi:MAG TPA: MBL fold metallo-hydrolase [Bdellovibrionota bacterium]|nr:MBL fold metallo-hydrolase [Bdellovibrionota bacterium]
MEIAAFHDTDTGTLTYLVWDPATQAAVIIDPVLGYDPASGALSLKSVEDVALAARERNLDVHWILETHVHADHLSGSQFLKERFSKAKLGIGERIGEVQALFSSIFGFEGAQKPTAAAFDHVFKDREEFSAGGLRFKVLATPGHTPACVSYVVGDAVFTGDALCALDAGTGRCDFPGGDAKTLFHSIHDVLYALPDETRTFAGHDYRPGGRALLYRSTIGEQKGSNPHLQAATTEESFVEFRTGRDRGLSAPRLLYPSLHVNLMGGRLPPPDSQGRRFLKLPIFAPAR